MDNGPLKTETGASAIFQPQPKGLPLNASRATNNWVIVVLLLLSVCINYIDRGSLSVAAPLLKEEVSLRPSQLCLFVSTLLWELPACQLGVGWVGGRFEFQMGYAA